MDGSVPEPHKRTIPAALALLAVMTSALAGQSGIGSVRAVPSLDLSRYAGLWYEQARLPNQFQNRCAARVTAEYTVLPDSTVRVLNRCVDGEGKLVSAEGRARLAQRGGPASRLRVRFAPAIFSFLSMVWADYWVLDLTEDYGAALVGTPDRRYLWVLSRQPELDSVSFDRLLATASAQGFDLRQLQRTRQQ
jgi:apolipoprotein D and lipocalin family protein